MTHAPPRWWPQGDHTTWFGAAVLAGTSTFAEHWCVHAPTAPAPPGGAAGHYGGPYGYSYGYGDVSSDDDGLGLDDDDDDDDDDDSEDGEEHDEDHQEEDHDDGAPELFRAIINTGETDIAMLVRVPTYKEGKHVASNKSKGVNEQFQTLKIVLRPGEMFSFLGATGVLLKHQAVISADGHASFAVMDYRFVRGAPRSPPAAPTVYLSYLGNPRRFSLNIPSKIVRPN